MSYHDYDWLEQFKDKQRKRIKTLLGQVESRRIIRLKAQRQETRDALVADQRLAHLSMGGGASGPRRPDADAQAFGRR